MASGFTAEVFDLARKRLNAVGIAYPRSDVVIGYGKAAADALGRSKPAGAAEAYRLILELVGHEKAPVVPFVAPEPKQKRPAYSQRWLRVRYQALVRDGGRCRCCGATAASGAVMHVDHIKPWSKHPDLAFELSNLQVLCSECNLGKSNVDETEWPVSA